MVATAESPTATATALKSRFVWYDLMSTDRAASLAFFQGLLGWTTTEIDMGPMGTYTMLFSDGAGLGGAVELDPADGHPSHFIGYIGCDDVDDVAARTPGLGGTVAVPPMDIPDVGRFTVIADPLGAYVSAITLLPGAPRTPETDTPFGGVAWNELITSDIPKSGAFYTHLFGWTTQPSAMPGSPDYTLLNHGDDMVAGMMKPEHPGMPSAWLFYFLVADLDAAVATLGALGGATVSEIIPVPTIGRLIVATDPAGATFALLESAM